jgi:hypothetical protein
MDGRRSSTELAASINRQIDPKSLVSRSGNAVQHLIPVLHGAWQQQNAAVTYMPPVHEGPAFLLVVWGLNEIYL